MRTASRAVALAAAGALLLAGCGRGSDERDAAAVRPTGPTSNTILPEAPPASAVAPSAVTTTGRRGGSAGNGAPSGGASPAPRNGALAPAPPGTYHYDTTGVSTFGVSSLPFPAVTTLTVDPPAGTRQHATRDLRDPTGNGSVQEMGLDFRPEGIFIDNLKLTTTIAGTTNSIDLRPTGRALLLPTGAAPGLHTEFDMTDGGGTARVVVDVLAREQVSVAGRGVDALVVRAVATLPGTDVAGQVEINYWFAPSVRLPVKERVVSDASAAGGLIRFHSEYQATIQRLP